MPSPTTQPPVTSSPTAKKERRARWPLILTVILVLAAAGGAWYWFKGRTDATVTADGANPASGVAPTGAPGGAAKGRPGAGGARPLAPVVVAPARTADVSVWLSGLGAVSAYNTVVVRTRVDGQLMRLNFKDGDTVKKGQLLAEIDDRALKAQLVQVEGQLLRDQALLQNARVDQARYRTLVAQDSVATQQLDSQDALVKQYEGTLKIDQGAVDNARLQLSFTRVTAPVAGRLGLRQVDVGNMVHAADASGIVTVTQMQPASVIFSVAEDNVTRIMKALKQGKPRVEAWDREQKNKLGDGVLLTADNLIDVTTGTVKLKALFRNEDDALFANQFVNMRLLLGVRRDVTVVPSAAIQRGTVGTFVYVVKPDQTVTIRPVRTGPVQGDDTTIESGSGERPVSAGGATAPNATPGAAGPQPGSTPAASPPASPAAMPAPTGAVAGTPADGARGGLRPGELVVVDGADRLREGMKVEAVTRDAARAAGAPRQRRPRGDGQGGQGAQPGATGQPAGQAAGQATPATDAGKDDGKRARKSGE